MQARPPPTALAAGPVLVNGPERTSEREALREQHAALERRLATVKARAAEMTPVPTPAPVSTPTVPGGTDSELSEVPAATPASLQLVSSFLDLRPHRCFVHPQAANI